MTKDLGEALYSTKDESNQYDEAAKRILGNKDVLAYILVNTVEEYKHMDPKDVVPLIEGEPYIGTVPISPGLTNISKSINGQRIVGMNGEMSDKNEGLVRFDVIFYVLTKDGYNKIIINLEAQRKEDPGYPILNRAIFYESREISSQKERDFTHSDYGKMKRCYSIWICMDCEENCMNHFHLVDDPIIGNHQWKGDIGIFNLVMIGINDQDLPEAEESKLHRFLCTLFSDPEYVTYEDKAKILDEEYHVWNDGIRKEVTSMCNLSQGIVERSIEQGIKKGQINTLVDLVKDNLLSVTNAAKKLGVTEKEFLNLMKTNN